MLQGRVQDTSYVELNRPCYYLNEIYKEYCTIGVKLAMFAEDIPVSNDMGVADDIVVTSLLDRQVTLLNSALEQSVQTLDDAKVLMKLWDAEVVQGRDISDLSAADALVKSIFDLVAST